MSSMSGGGGGGGGVLSEVPLGVGGGLVCVKIADTHE